MLSYWLACKKKNTEYKDAKLIKTKNDRLMLSRCTICGNKNSRFIKEQEAKRLVSNLGIKSALNKIPLLGDLLF